MHVKAEVEPVPVLQLVLAAGTIEQLPPLPVSRKYPFKQVVQVVPDPVVVPVWQFTAGAPVITAQVVGEVAKAYPLVHLVH